jgi:hypothetical protein
MELKDIIAESRELLCRSGVIVRSWSSLPDFSTMDS